MAEKEILEAIKRDYVNTYSTRICYFLFNAFPEEAKQAFGSIENCIKEVADDAEVWFEKWAPNFISGIIARVKGSPTKK